MHARNQELSKREQAILERENAYKSRESDWEKKKSFQPLEALKELGYEDARSFLEMVAKTGGEVSPEQRELYELKKWRQEAERKETERAERDKQEREAAQYKQSVDQWHGAIANYVKQDASLSKSVLALPNAQASVFQTLQEHMQRTGERLDLAEAAEQTRKSMMTQMQEAMKQIAGNPEGLAILQDTLAKLAPNDAKRGKSTARNNGISNAVRNETRSTPLEDVDIDTALAQASAFLREKSRR